MPPLRGFFAFFTFASLRSMRLANRCSRRGDHHRLERLRSRRVFACCASLADALPDCRSPALRVGLAVSANCLLHPTCSQINIIQPKTESPSVGSAQRGHMTAIIKPRLAHVGEAAAASAPLSAAADDIPNTPPSFNFWASFALGRSHAPPKSLLVMRADATV